MDYNPKCTRSNPITAQSIISIIFARYYAAIHNYRFPAILHPHLSDRQYSISSVPNPKNFHPPTPANHPTHSNPTVNSPTPHLAYPNQRHSFGPPGTPCQRRRLRQWQWRYPGAQQEGRMAWWKGRRFRLVIVGFR